MTELNDFEKKVAGIDGGSLLSQKIDSLQINLGLRCNQQCAHCHLEAGPQRSEMMEWLVMDMILKAAARVRPRLVDLTGGAPELNAHFRRFVQGFRQEGLPVQV
jgi:molybdenum cofactor biosynthesis enzyme MoaA